MLRLFIQRLPFRVVLFLTILIIGFTPLFFSALLNLPKVLEKFTELTEAEHVNQINKQVHSLELLLRRYEEDIRIVSLHPDVQSLVSAKPSSMAQPVVSLNRLSKLLDNLFARDSLEELFIINSRTQVEYIWPQAENTEQSGLYSIASHIGFINLWFEEAKSRQPGDIFVASMYKDPIFSGKRHKDIPKILLAVPLVDSQGNFGGVVVGKFFLLTPGAGTTSYDLMTNGLGSVFYDRTEPVHENSGQVTYNHLNTTVLADYPDLVNASEDSLYIFSSGSRDEKMLFRQVLPDKHKEHSLWIANIVDSSILDHWVYSFVLRFLIICSVLTGGGLIVAMFITRKTDQARSQLITSVTELVRSDKPIDLPWTWPLELSDLSKKLHSLSTTLLASEESLQRQTHFIRGIFDGIQDGVAVINRDFVVVDTNKTLKNWRSELAPLTAKKCYQVVRHRGRPCVSCPAQRVLTEKTMQSDEFSVFEPDGAEKWFEVTAYPIFDDDGQVNSVVEFFRDITTKKQADLERKSLEQQLIFAQKMESIGTLAGGVAHDFNNMLSAINGYAQLSLMRMTADDPHRDAMDAILRSGNQAARITQQLLAFSRKQIIQLEPVDLNVEIEETSKMLGRLLGDDIEVVIHGGRGVWMIQADRTQIGQVLINLAVNARDAMEGGGTLTIETRNHRFANRCSQTRHEIPAGEYVLLSISDTGEGMSKEIMAHIFEPFFTTKKKGKGTGLGLATSYGIIQQHGGSIHVYSEPGEGTVFKIYLPRILDQKAVACRNVPGENTPVIGGDETILLVEDDPMVRAVCVEILIELGYTVLEAENGHDGLQVFERYHGNIDLLLTDVVMPKMGGVELAQTIRKRSTDIRVLYMSGYTENTVVHQDVLEEGINFVHKPITPPALAAAIRELLAAP